MALVVGTLSIGRAGLDSGVTIEDPQTQDINGSQITWTGYLSSTSLAGAKALRQQLLGYVDNPDELWVPVVCSWDASLTGFYRVLSASASAIPGVSYSTQSADLMYNLPYSVTVEQVVGYSKPNLESILTGALRTNVSSITAANMTAFTLVPSGSSAGVGYSSFTTETRTSADGLDVFFSLANPTLPLSFQFALDPVEPTATNESGWYQAAAKLESQALDGVTYRAVVGRNLPYRTSVYAPGHDWRLSNGYVRVAPAVITGASSPASCDITVSHFDGTVWDTAVRYTFSVAGTSLTAAGVFGQIAVLRNDPACVSIRLSVLIYSRAWLLDLTLRRGSRNVECRWSLDLAGVVIVARATAEAATAITGGIRATANDASGNRYVMAAAQTVTNDLVNGKLTSGSVTALDFMLGSEVTGSSATGQGTAQNQIYQWICAQSETYRLVGR